jgi:hypothetical protein
MIEPTGPLPPAVYWRRRGVAVGVCVLAVLLLAWIIGGLVGSADDQPVQGTAGTRDLVATPSSAPPSARPAGPSASPTSRGFTASATASPVASPTSPPAAAPVMSPTTSTSRRPSPPPKHCPDGVIRVAAMSGAQSYRVGERPLLRLLVVNTGPVPCTRDVSRNLRELVIMAAGGRKRLWSSNDCYPPTDRDVRVLAPGNPVRFSLNWAGRTSAPGCPVDRVTVESGTYRLIGKLGKITSPPARLTLTD